MFTHLPALNLINDDKGVAAYARLADGPAIVMEQAMEALAELQCDVCNGYGHTLAVCPTYARLLQTISGHPDMKRLFRLGLAGVVG